MFSPTSTKSTSFVDRFSASSFMPHRKCVIERMRPRIPLVNGENSAPRVAINDCYVEPGALPQQMEVTQLIGRIRREAHHEDAERNFDGVRAQYNGLGL